MASAVRLKPSDATKRLIAGKQSYKCANSPNKNLSGIENYQCPLWQKSNDDNKGSFDESGFELDHINELSVSHDNSIENFQALCKSCHSVKTRKFLMKKSRNLYHPVYGKFIYRQGDHNIYLADSLVITQHSKIWSKNRPCDQQRVDEIKEYIKKNSYVDGILCFANMKNEGLVCYDGNHRRESLKLLNKNYKVFINVIENPNHDYLCEKFVSLNKCIPITDLYLDTSDKLDNFKKNINVVTKYFCNLWKIHRNTSPRPNRPNFNRDMLQQKIYDILGDLHNIDSNVMIARVNTYNLNIKDNLARIKCTENMLEKCRRGGCYLFLKK